ncbi:PepSY domain-containing protein [Rhodococcus sp. BE178]|uniref:PepSY domain-containing protein n=1 Tax=Rhodococcus sp. BE178 TaxID=2817737 RepID=UPI003D23290A
MRRPPGSNRLVDAQQPPPTPGILGVELDEEGGRPTVEVDFVDLEGGHREVDIDLQTGRIIEDEPEGDQGSVSRTAGG